MDFKKLQENRDKYNKLLIDFVKNSSTPDIIDVLFPGSNILVKSNSVLKEVEEMLIDYPQLRFGQALYNCSGIRKEGIDYFNEEPSVTYGRIK